MFVFYRTIVPDFFVGREPWAPDGDWSTFPEWIKSRNAREVNRYVISRLDFVRDTAQGGAGLHQTSSLPPCGVEHRLTLLPTVHNELWMEADMHFRPHCPSKHSCSPTLQGMSSVGRPHRCLLASVRTLIPSGSTAQRTIVYRTKEISSGLK